MYCGRVNGNGSQYVQRENLLHIIIRADSINKYIFIEFNMESQPTHVAASRVFLVIKK